MSTAAIGHGTRSVQIEMEVRAERRSDRFVTAPITAEQIDDDRYRITVSDTPVGFIYRVGHVFVAMRGSRWDKAEECGQALRWDLAVRQLVTASGVLAEDAPDAAPRPQSAAGAGSRPRTTDGRPRTTDSRPRTTIGGDSRSRALQDGAPKDHALKGPALKDHAPKEHTRKDRTLKDPAMQDRAMQDRAPRDQLLQDRTLQDRVLIERAKGVLAELGGMRMAEASAVLRTYADQNHLSERSAAMAIILARAEQVQPAPVATPGESP